jgi:hypothetical protein
VVVAHVSAVVELVDGVQREEDRLRVREGGRELGALDDPRAHAAHHRLPDVLLHLLEHLEPALHGHESIRL